MSKKKPASLGRKDFPAASDIAEILEQSTQPGVDIKECIKTARQTLANAQLKGASSTNLINNWTRFIDLVLVTSWNFVNETDTNASSHALVAVGGYGRKELHPSSDIDIMILVSDHDESSLYDTSKQFLHLLWDIGLDVGHSVRTVAECKKEAADLTVITNLMEARRLCGSNELLTKMQEAISPEHIWPADEFLHAKLEEQRNRHIRFGETAYKLEPNLKESPGGLRDLQMISWVTMRYFHTGSLHELVEHDFLTQSEYQSLIRCRNFLWRLRNGLHLLTGRREDRLLFEHQRELAKSFGYEDKPGHLAVEQLMKRYYRTVKELGLLNDILIQHFEEAFLAQQDLEPTEINRRFQSVSGYLDVVDNDVFERQPFALIEAFYLLQERPELKGMRANIIRLIHQSLGLITKEFRQDIACRSLFISMFRYGAGLTRVLRKMNEYGVLGAYFPAFGRVVGLMQHDLFHIYTVDVHTLFVLRNLRRLAVEEHTDEHPLASKLMATIFKPERLYLAALLHDIAKGRGGDHSRKGELIALQFCRRHDMSEYDAKFVAWLVLNHLIMSWTTQKKDISDPHVIEEFADLVGNQERLDNLYLLTMADMRGTSPKVWNEWKGKLLQQLYNETTAYFRRGGFIAEEARERVASIQNELMVRLVPAVLPGEKFVRYCSLFEDDYFLRYDMETLSWHIKTLAYADAISLPVVNVRYSRNSGSTEVLVFTPDLTDLLVRTTAGFDLLNLNIVDARLHSTSMGFALHNYQVLDQNDKPVIDKQDRRAIEEALISQLHTPRSGRDPHKSHLPRQIKQFPIPTAVRFAASYNKLQTIIEVTAQDRPGLLYQIAEVFDACRIKLHNAKVATFGARVEDIFYVTTRSDEPIDNEKQRDAICNEIIQRIDGDSGDADNVTFSQEQAPWQSPGFNGDIHSKQTGQK
jgi:[protein-PII] uridylyltransferase